MLGFGSISAFAISVFDLSGDPAPPTTELIVQYRFISLQRDYNTDTIHFSG